MPADKRDNKSNKKKYIHQFETIVEKKIADFDIKNVM